MATKPRLREAEALELYSVALSNASSQAEIAKALDDIGFSQEKLEHGMQLLEKTRKVNTEHIAYKGKLKNASAILRSNIRSLTKYYVFHRKKAKLVYRDDPLMLDRLALLVQLPRSYAGRYETIEKFYRTVNENPGIQQELQELKITPDEVKEALNKLEEMEDSHDAYYRAKGDARDSTVQKDKAIFKMTDWMSKFYGVAKLALADQPELLESLCKK